MANKVNINVNVTINVVNNGSNNNLNVNCNMDKKHGTSSSDDNQKKTCSKLHRYLTIIVYILKFISLISSIIVAMMA